MELYNRESINDLIFISHRGNINGKDPSRENSLEYLLAAMDDGYDVEFDVRYVDNRFWLGHDEPQWSVDYSFLQGEKKWVHCKNIEAFCELHDDPSVNCFWHENDKYTLTSRLFVWAMIGEPCCRGAICVLPEYSKRVYPSSELEICAGICSDYISKYKAAHEVRKNIRRK